MTRRQILAGLCAPLLASAHESTTTPQTSVLTILAEAHLLSADSARAFCRLIEKHPPIRRPTFLLPACKHLTIEAASYLREQAESGTAVLIESGLAFSDDTSIAQQRRVLARGFQLTLGEAIAAPHNEAHYIAFTRPCGAMVRPFGLTFPIRAENCESIAHFGQCSVAVRKTIGRGQLVYLGSMLGPHLLSDDRDAHHAATHLLVG